MTADYPAIAPYLLHDVVESLYVLRDLEDVRLDVEVDALLWKIQDAKMRQKLDHKLGGSRSGVGLGPHLEANPLDLADTPCGQREAAAQAGCNTYITTGIALALQRQSIHSY